MQQQGLNIQQLENGNLHIMLTPEGREFLNDYLEDENSSYQGLWSELIEQYAVNGSYQTLLPEEIGALTCSPIIGLCERDENNAIIDHEDNKFWWLPDYMVIDEFREILMEDQALILTLAK